MHAPANMKLCSCGKKFVCAAETGDCWCMKLPAVVPVPKQTEGERRGACLCPDCLERAIAQMQKGKAT